MIFFSLFFRVSKTVFETFTYVGTCQFREREMEGERAATGSAAQCASLHGHTNFSLGHEGAYIESQTSRLLLLALENRIC